MKRCLGLRTQKHSKKALEGTEAKKEREEGEKKEGVGSEALKGVKRIFEIPERIGEIETPQETKDIFEFLNMMVSIDIKTINKINNAVDKMEVKGGKRGLKLKSGIKTLKGEIYACKLGL